MKTRVNLNRKNPSLVRLVIFLSFFCTSFLSASPICVPDFIIIGVQKGGTTSLFSYLKMHPQVSINRKEIHFFDLNYHKGLEWYETVLARQKKAKGLVGEATPRYFFYHHVPERMHNHYPNLKLILILRNPVDRAFSAYKMMVRNGDEKRSFADVVKAEINTSNTEKDSIVNRGIYITQLQRWMQFFKPNQLLILFSEDLFNQPEACMQKVHDFLNISHFVASNYEILNSDESKNQIPQEIRKALINFYSPYNEALEQYLKHTFGIDSKLPW